MPRVVTTIPPPLTPPKLPRDRLATRDEAEAYAAWMNRELSAANYLPVPVFFRATGALLGWDVEVGGRRLSAAPVE